MKAVRADYPTDWPHANVYTLADLHIGDPHSIPTEITRRLQEAAQDPYGLVILNGAALDYGGYGQAQEFKPASFSTPVIHLEAKDKRMSATL